MRSILMFISMVVISVTTYAQQPLRFYTQDDVDIFNEYLSKFGSKKDMAMGKLVVETGKFFLNTPYVNYTLEASEPEALIINIRELDCVTFVETVIALSRTIKSGNHTFDEFGSNLQEIRFRDGKIKDFTSRLHYFSDWIYNNQSRGIVEDLTENLGGDPYPMNPKIMSSYPDNYRQMVNNPEFIPVMSAIEDSIASRKMYSIPRSRVENIDDKLENGYLIATTTKTAMDISHSGFVVIEGRKAHFMHASSKEKRVVITELILSDYLKSISSMTGIMVVQVL